MDEDNSAGEHANAEAETVGFSTFSNEVSATPWFSAENIRDRLESGDVPLALLQASTTMERILYLKIRDRFDVPHDEFESIYSSKSLGEYLQICNTLDLTDDAYRDSLDDLVDKRNNLAHEHGYIEDLETDADERNSVVSLIEDTCDWIDSTEP